MIAKLFASLDYRHWILTHLVWLMALTVALVIGNIALKEHDQRVAADAAIKVSQANITNLQQQIKDRDAAATQKIQVITKIVHDLPPNATTGQIVAAVPQLTDAPLNARTIPGDPVNVSVAAMPLVTVLQQAAVDHVANSACQADLTTQKAISAQQNLEIAALKKKPSFLKRVKHVAQAVGVGIAIGLLLK
jgi:hypothetical protein